MITRLERHKQALDYCTYCPKLCTFACPVSNAEKREAVTPWAKMTLANLLRKGLVPLEHDTVEPLYHCLACRLCTTYCKHEIEVGEVLTDARALLIEKGVVHPRLQQLREAMVGMENPNGTDLAGTLKTLVPERYFVDDAQAVYWPDWESLSALPNEIRATFSLFEKLGIDYISCYTGPGFCAGLPLYRAGFHREFKELAKQVAERLMNYKLIVCSSPEAVYTLKALYLELGYNFSDRVMHISQCLDSYLSGMEIANKLEDIPAYHSSAYLTRYLGEESRVQAILNNVSKHQPVSLVWEGKSSYPSGTLDVYEWMFPEAADAISRECLRQAVEVRAELIVTDSPKEALALSKVRQADDPSVKTLAEVLDACLT